MTDALTILATFLPSQKRTLGRTGIVLDNIIYFDEALAQWVGERLRLDVITDDRDISYVIVQPPIGPLVKARATTRGIPAISRSEWRARRRAEIAISKDPKLIAMADASLARSDALVATTKQRKSVRRRQATAAAGDNFRHTSSPSPPPEPPAKHELPTEVTTPPTTPTFYDIEDSGYDT